MKKKSSGAFQFLFSVFLTALFVFVAYVLPTASLELDRKSDTLSRLKASTAADHKVQFRAASTINSGLVSINFGDLVADRKNVGAVDVRLLYGVAGSEAEYLVQDAAGNGIWGAAFSLNGSSTVITLNYPASNGVPINAGNNIIVHIGTDPRVDTPPVQSVTVQSETLTTTTPQIIISDSSQSASQPTVQEPLAPGEQPTIVELVPYTGGSTANLRVVPLPDFAAIQDYIKDRLVKLRNLVTNKSAEIRPEGEPVIIGNAPSGQGGVSGGSSGGESGGASAPAAQSGVQSTTWSSWSGGQQENSTTPAPPDEDRKHLISLAEPKSEVIDVQRENSVSLERSDGGRLDIFVPAGAAPEAKSISIDVKPLTVEQSKEWSKLRVDGDKKPMLAQLYVVTATDDKAQPVTEFEKPIKYNFHFTAKEIEEEGIDPHTLAVYSWDAGAETLTREPSTVDLDANVVTAQIYHLTTFFLLGEPRPQAEKTKEPSGVAVIPSVVLPRIAIDAKSETFGLTNASTSQTITFAGNDFYTTPNTRLSFCIPRRIFPKPVREITLLADKFPQPFVLNKEKDCYGASFVSPGAQGKKSLSIKMVYADDQVQIISYRVNVIASELQVKVFSAVAPRVEEVRAAASVVNKQVEKAVVTTQPVLQTTAIATGAGVTALNPTIISNSLNWYHYFNHFLTAILSALGLRKRRRPWGVAYNAITKMPIDLAIVRLFDSKNSKLIETQVTDKEGRFSFLASLGEYTLTVTKPPFLFPSKIVQGSRDGEYAGVYHDATLKITQANETMDLSIPLDPPNPKEEKAATSLFGGIKEFARNYSGVSLVLSLAVSILLALYAPSALNSILLLVNSLFVISQSLFSTRKEKEWGTIFDTLSFEPVPLAAISMINAKEGKLLRTRLSDYLGRFSFLPPPGEYSLVVMKEGYAFPPARMPKNKKFKDLYLGGTFVVKKKKALVKTNIPVEKRLKNQEVGIKN